MHRTHPRERFQVHAALDFQEVLLARDNAGKSVGTGVNLLRALFQVVRHGHHAQAQFAGHFHVARFEFGEFHGIKVSTLLVEHVVYRNHATPVVHFRDAVRTGNQGIKFGVIAPDARLQLLQVGLYRLELGGVLHKDRYSRVGKGHACKARQDNNTTFERLGYPVEDLVCKNYKLPLLPNLQGLWLHVKMLLRRGGHNDFYYQYPT